MHSPLEKRSWYPRDELICPIELLNEALFHDCRRLRQEILLWYYCYIVSNKTNG